jgi:hypothetical protein
LTWWIAAQRFQDERIAMVEPKRALLDPEAEGISFFRVIDRGLIAGIPDAIGALFQVCGYRS